MKAAKCVASEACPAGGENNGNIPNYNYVWRFEFDHVVSPSKVHLEMIVDTPKDVPCKDKSGDYSCKTPLKDIGPGKQTTLSYAHPVILKVQSEGNKRTVTYEVVIHPYIYKICHIKSFSFTWSASKTTWSCQRDGNRWRCRYK